MPDEAAAKALEIATKLLGVVGKVEDELGPITAQVKRTRRLVRVVTFSVIIDIALSVTLAFLLANQAHISMSIRQSQVTACRTVGNDARAAQVRLWNHVLGIAAVPRTETPAEKKARLAKLAAFRLYIGRQFRPVNCARLYH